MLTPQVLQRKATVQKGLSNRILRKLANEMSVPPFFNQPLQSGVVPASYKGSNVCPLPKKDDPAMVNNFRLISLLHVRGKDL